MAAARGLDAGFGRAGRQLAGTQRGIAVDRAGNPAIGLGVAGRQLRPVVGRQRAQVGHRLAGQLVQGLVGVGQRVAGQDGAGAGLVVLGAGFMHVGDRGQAHFQALVRIVELALAGGLVGLGRRQRLDRHQHVEIGRGGAHHQAVIGRVQVVVGGLAERTLGAQAGELAPVEQGLAGAQAVAAAGAGERSAHALRLGARAGDGGVAGQLRQQRGAGLDLAFLVVQRVGLGDRQLGVAAAGHFIGLQQVGGLGGARGQGGGQGQGEGSADHRRLPFRVDGARWTACRRGECVGLAAPRGGGQNWNWGTGSAPCR